MEDERNIHRRCRVCGKAKPLAQFERYPPSGRRHVCRACRSRRRMRRKLEARSRPIPERYEDPKLTDEQVQRIKLEAQREGDPHPWDFKP